jgi:hypothetical protein
MEVGSCCEDGDASGENEDEVEPAFRLAAFLRVLLLEVYKNRYQDFNSMAIVLSGHGIDQLFGSRWQHDMICVAIVVSHTVGMMLRSRFEVASPNTRQSGGHQSK